MSKTTGLSEVAAALSISKDSADAGVDVASDGESDVESDAGSDAREGPPVAVYDILTIASSDPELRGITVSDFPGMVKIRRNIAKAEHVKTPDEGDEDVSMDEVEAARKTHGDVQENSHEGVKVKYAAYHTFSIHLAEFVARGYCNRGVGDSSGSAPFKNFYVQWFQTLEGITYNSSTQDEVWDGDSLNGVFFKDGMVNDDGVPLLGFLFHLNDAWDGKRSTLITPVFGWAKLRKGVGSCVPAAMSEAEKGRLQIYESTKAVADFQAMLQSRRTKGRL